MTGSYSRVAIILHWLIAILILGQLAGGLAMVRIGDANSALKFQIFQLHKSFGFTILALSVFRLFWRLTHKVPALPADMQPWEKLAARATHWGFYGFLIVTPLLGWAYVSSAPFAVPTYLFGVIPIPDLPLARGAEAAEALSEAHEAAALLMAALLVVHIGAALKHHFYNRDDVLVRMAPFLRRKG